MLAKTWSEYGFWQGQIWSLSGGRAGSKRGNIRQEPYALHKQVNRSAFGQIRFQSPVAHETHLGQNEPEAVRHE